MNKNLKRTIALALAIGTVSAVVPATNVNLLTAKVYAATTGDNTKEDLESLQLESSNGNNIKIYSESDYDSDSKLAKKDSPSEDTYYAKTDYSKVNVKIDGPAKKYVKVFKSTSKSPSDSTKGKSVSDDISLSSGTNYITVRVYKDEPDSKVRYDDDFASEYVIKVKCNGNNSDSDSSSSSDNADDYDDIYLDKLTVDDGTNVKDIALSDSKIKYTYDVANNIREVIVKAEPKDEDEDTIEINDDEVDDYDHYKKKISLNVGENKIKITTENEDDEDREYTLIINRAAAAATTVKAATTASTTATATAGTATAATTAVKTKQWVIVNGRDQYNDSLGHPVKNAWQAYGASWYYLGADGNMVTNCWKTSAAGDNWYYLGSNGAMVTNCWVTTNGAYYYLSSDGSMATNTVINGYRVGANGAWVR